MMTIERSRVMKVAHACAPACIPLFVLAAGCDADKPDAYGNFEAVEVRVSAEVGGTLLTFDAVEGESIGPGAVVGQVDTTELALQRQELEAQRDVARSRSAEGGAQTRVLLAEMATAEEEYQRTRRLYEAEAATAQQLTQAEGAVRVLRERLAAVRAQASAAERETGGAEARIERLGEQIRKSRVVNPIAGTVLTTYVEAGEFVQPGQPLYTIADLGTLTLRAYVAGNQLASIRIGQPVEVAVDSGDGELLRLPGRVAWIAAEAEFTPTPIQTRDERVDQVYAVKITVQNPDGVLKIGMPGEVYIGSGEGGGDGGAAAVGTPAGRSVLATRR